MKPVSLKSEFLTSCCPPSPSDSSYPTVYLQDVKGLAIPEEGEITFTFKRDRLDGSLDKHGGKLSASLCLKEILNVKEVDIEPEGDERAEEAVEKLFEALSEADLPVDESEDDNPSKY